MRKSITRGTTALLMTLALASLGLAQISFGPPTTLPVGTQPDSVAIADFNGDGIADLAVTVDVGAGPDNVAIFFGTGAGAFGAPVFVVLPGSSAQELKAADFNLDGDQDLVVALANSNSVAILTNNGTGVFTAGAPIAVGAEPRRIATGDLNGDGFPDIAVANRDSDNVSVLIGTAGTFTTSTTFAAGAEPRGIAIADLNGDGANDIAVSNHDARNVQVLANNGAGSFTSANILSLGAILRPEGLVAVDLNNDGLADLAAAANGGGLEVVTVWLRTGAGFSGLAVFPTGGIDTSELAAADFDGNGFLDLATANNTSNNVSVLANNGAGGFGAPTLLVAGTEPGGLAASDLDGNGSADLAVANKLSNNVMVFLNQGGGMPVLPTFPGSGEDFQLLTAVGPMATPTTGAGQDVKTATANDLLRVRFVSPFGLFNFLPPILVAQLAATGALPGSPFGFPEVHVNPAANPGPVVLVNGPASSGFGPSAIVLPGGNDYGFLIPPGLAGVSVMLQALVQAGFASNGIFATTDAHEIQVQ